MGGTAPVFSFLTHSFCDSQVPEVVHRDARKKGGARRTAPVGCGPASEGKVSCAGKGARTAARAAGRRLGGAGAAAFAGSEWLAAGGGSERPGESRLACRPPGLQPLLLRLAWVRPLSALPRLGAEAAPPTARSRSAPPPLLPGRSVGRSVSQSVTERAAREQRTLTASLGKERRAWGGGGGGGGGRSPSGDYPG